jgi:hypothetical protein
MICTIEVETMFQDMIERHFDSSSSRAICQSQLPYAHYCISNGAKSEGWVTLFLEMTDIVSLIILNTTQCNMT